MIVPLVLGAIVGLGALASWRLLFPPAPPLQTAIERLNRRNELVGITNRNQDDHNVNDLLGRTVGAALSRFMRNAGLQLSSLEADLRLVGRSIEQHMAQKVVAAGAACSFTAHHLAHRVPGVMLVAAITRAERQ